MFNYDTLTEQAHMNMHHRACELARKMEIEITKAKLRELYQKSYVTKQKILTTAEPKDATRQRM